MGRPKINRIVRNLPSITYFEPHGIPVENLLTEKLAIEELEALSLKHYEKLNQIDCAKRMNVSQSTFSRILENAHERITRALVEGKAIQLSGGNFEIKKLILGYECSSCLHDWSIELDENLITEELSSSELEKLLPIDSSIKCPNCESENIHRIKKYIII